MDWGKAKRLERESKLAVMFVWLGNDFSAEIKFILLVRLCFGFISLCQIWQVPGLKKVLVKIVLNYLHTSMPSKN